MRSDRHVQNNGDTIHKVARIIKMSKLTVSFIQCRNSFLQGNKANS